MITLYSDFCTVKLFCVVDGCTAASETVGLEAWNCSRCECLKSVEQQNNVLPGRFVYIKYYCIFKCLHLVCIIISPSTSSKYNITPTTHRWDDDGF